MSGDEVVPHSYKDTSSSCSLSIFSVDRVIGWKTLATANVRIQPRLGTDDDVWVRWLDDFSEGCSFAGDTLTVKY